MKASAIAREAAFAALPFLGFAVTAWWLGHFFVDDSYISFRYARNLVRGDGLVFNPGERVEGYTNFLWVIALAGGLFLGAGAERAAEVLGIACALVSIFFTYRLCAHLTRKRWSLLASAMLGCSTPFVFWTFSGMETVAFAALITLGAWSFIRSSRTNDLIVAMAAFSLACLTRPEGVLVLVISLATLLVSPVEPRGRRLAVALGTTAVFLLPYAAWKTWYYADLLPNTFYAKVGSRIDQAIRGLRYVGNFAIFAAAAGLLPSALLSVGRRDWRRAYLAALVVGQTVYVVLVGGDSFVFYRFLVPILPFLCVLAALGFESLHEAMVSGVPSLPTPRSISVAVVAAALLISAGYGQQGHYRKLIGDKAAINGRYERIGEWLKEHSQPDDPIAVIAAGIIPYVSDLPTIDMLGLTDRHIARRSIDSMGSGMAGHEKGDGRYVLSREPRYILIHPITTGSPAAKEEIALGSRSFVSTRELWGMPEFHQRYELRSVRIEGFYFNYFEKVSGG